METPGMMLKREREARGLTIKYIASETKISESSLIAIENNDFNAFPAEVFIRGFLRNYARALSLSSEEVIAAYDALRHQNSERVAPVVAIEEIRETAREAVAANTNEDVRNPQSTRGFNFSYLAVAIALFVVACVTCSVMFTGTGEAEENNGYYQESNQTVEDPSPFIISNHNINSDSWSLQ